MRWDLEAIEAAARRKAMGVAARAVAGRINADTSDHAGPTISCSTCGKPARYAGRRDKTFDSVLGPLPLNRAYYHCDSCETGFCPRDRALGLEGGSLSPGVLRMVGRVGAMVSLEEGHELLHELAGVEVPAKHVERAAEALGREIAEDERRAVEPLPEGEPVAPTLYLGMDGTGVPTRASELEGREGKQPDGSSETREVKLVTVWSAEGRDDEGTPIRDEGSVTYSAAIESAAQRETDDVPSDFAARHTSRDDVVAAHQQITLAWWATRDRYDHFVSEAVLAEAGGGDPLAAQRRLSALANLPVLTITGEVGGLAARIVDEGALPRRGFVDAVHVAACHSRNGLPADLELRPHRQREDPC